MKNLLCLSMFVLACLMFASTAFAQCEGNLYTTSLSWQSAGSAHGFTSTELDYCAGLYYDPANSGSFIETFNTQSAVIGEGYTEGQSDLVPAQLSFDYFGPINNGGYTTTGNHYVIAYYQAYVPQFNEYLWYDPLNLGFEEIDNESFLAPDEYAHFGYVSYWASSPQFVGNTSDTITYTGQSQCLPGQQFTGSGEPCSSLPGCESGLQFSSTGEICPNYVPPVEPPGGFSLDISFDNNTLIPSGVPGSSNTYLRACITGSGNTSGVEIALEKEDMSEATGHVEVHHSGNRPLGVLGKSRGFTNGQGCFVTTYKPSFIAGKVRVVGSVSGSNFESWDTVYVKVDNLVDLGQGTNYRLNGSSDPRDCDAPQCTAIYMSAKHRKAHPFNHWVVPAAKPALVAVANEYKQQFYGSGYIPPAEMVTYNDASLKWGGKFEGKLNWMNRSWHAEHREGKNIDTKSQNIPSSRVPAFRAIVNRNNFGILHHTVKAPHFHFRWGNLENSTTTSTVLQNGIDSNITAIDGVPITPSDLASNAAEAIFERPVTQDEFESWYPQLTNAKTQGSTAFLQEVKTFYQQLFASQEYVLRQRTDAQFVEDVFASHLIREPTEQELSYWTGYLINLGAGVNEPIEPDFPEDLATRSGSTNPTLSQAQRRQMFLNYFQTMPQFVDKVGSVVDDAYPEPTP